MSIVCQALDSMLALDFLVTEEGSRKSIFQESGWAWKVQQATQNQKSKHLKRWSRALFHQEEDNHQTLIGLKVYKVRLQISTIGEIRATTFDRKGFSGAQIFFVVEKLTLRFMREGERLPLLTLCTDPYKNVCSCLVFAPTSTFSHQPQYRLFYG